MKIIKNLKHISSQLTYITAEKMPNVTDTEALAKHYASKGDKKDDDLSVPAENQKLPDGLETMLPDLVQKSQVSVLAIGLAIRYLEDQMIASATIPLSRFRPYTGETSDAFINMRTHMLLDSATLESLEIFSDYLPRTYSYHER